MVIKHSNKELLAKSMVTLPMKCIVVCYIQVTSFSASLYIVILSTRKFNRFCVFLQRVVSLGQLLLTEITSFLVWIKL